MSNDYGGTFITLTDENGEEIVLEYLDTVEYEGKNLHVAFFPTIDEETDPRRQRRARSTAWDYHARGARRRRDELVTLDSEEAEAVYNLFMESAFEDDEDLEGNKRRLWCIDFVRWKK